MKINIEELLKELTLLKEALVNFELRSFVVEPEHTSMYEVDPLDIAIMDDIGIAYTTLGDNEELEIQVTLNVPSMEIETVVSGTYTHVKMVDTYTSIKEIYKELNQTSFEDYIEVDKFDIDNLIEKEYLMEIIQGDYVYLDYYTYGTSNKLGIDNSTKEKNVYQFLYNQLLETNVNVEVLDGIKLSLKDILKNQDIVYINKFMFFKGRIRATLRLGENLVNVDLFDFPN